MYLMRAGVALAELSTISYVWTPLLSNIFGRSEMTVISHRQADLFRQLHPLLWDGGGLKPEAFDLFRSAGAREW